MNDNEYMRGRLRAKGYAFLSACYYPPDDSFAAVIEDAGKSCGTMAAEICRGLPAKEDVEKLSRDYARLFVGPFKTLAPPYGSVYMETDGVLMGESTADVLRWYKEDGMKNTLHEPPDHIIVELEYLHFLVTGAVNTASDGLFEECSRYLMREHSFLSSHPARWVPAFTSRMEAHAETDFYGSLADVTRRFVAEAAADHPLDDLCGTETVGSVIASASNINGQRGVQ